MSSLPKIINDPVHQVMVFNESQDLLDLLKEICDHPQFQRLRRIKQLGCGDLIFPGAVHTRFNHCLGACYLAKRFSDRLELPAKERKLAMVSALVHDIGHGPLSHAFEKVYGEKKVRIIHDKNWNKKFFEKYGIFSADDLKCINAIFDEKPNDAKELGITLIRDIVSSQLDVDRLDYLLRDGHFCGVPYGQIDLNWIISCLDRVEIKGGTRLGVTRKGIGAIEHYLAARRLMTRNIYYHGKKNAAEFYMQKFLEHLMLDISNDESYIKRRFKELKGSMLGQFLIALNEYKDTVSEMADQELINKEKMKFVNKNFKIYCTLTDDDIWITAKKIYQIGGKGNCSKIATSLIERNLPSYYALSPSRIVNTKQFVRDFLKKNKSIKDWQVHVDELNFISYDQEKEPIYMIDSKDKKIYSDLYYESNLLNLLTGKKEYTDFLYIDQRVSKECRSLVNTLNKHGCLIYPYLK